MEPRREANHQFRIPQSPGQGAARRKLLATRQAVAACVEVDKKAPSGRAAPEVRFARGRLGGVLGASEIRRAAARSRRAFPLWSKSTWPTARIVDGQM